MKTFLMALAVTAAIAIPAFAQDANSSATTNPPSTAVGSGTAKALEPGPPAAAPQHDSTNTTAKPHHHKVAAAHHPRMPRAAQAAS